jgi:hypothetical protein
LPDGKGGDQAGAALFLSDRPPAKPVVPVMGEWPGCAARDVAATRMVESEGTEATGDTTVDGGRATHGGIVPAFEAPS